MQSPAKQYLKELKKLNACIDQKLREKAVLYSGSLKAVRTDRERVKASGGADITSNLALKLIDLETEIDREIDAFVDKKRAVVRQIQTLRNAAYMELLYKRYVEFKTLEEIASEMSYTYPYVRKIHGRALQEFQRIHEQAIAANMGRKG